MLVALAGCDAPARGDTAADAVSVMPATTGVAAPLAVQASAPVEAPGDAAPVMPEGWPVAPTVAQPAAPAWRAPEWMRDVRQPKSVAKLYAKGMRGPLVEPFVGFVVCEVSVKQRRWDDVPFGSAVLNLPDLRVRGPSRVVCLPDNRTRGRVGFPDLHLDRTSTITLDLDDVDGLVDDDITQLTLSAAGGFPMRAEDDAATATCVGVPPEAYARELAGRRGAAAKAVALAEAGEVPIDLSQGRPPAAIERGREAVRQLAMFAGPGSAEVMALVDRLEAVHAGWQRRLFAAIDASIAAAAPAGAWRELASARIRTAPGKPVTLEIFANKPLRYDWRPGRFDSFGLWFVDPAGERVLPNFIKLTMNGEALGPFEVRVPRGKLFTMHFPLRAQGAVYVVAAEGKQAHYFPLASGG